MKINLPAGFTKMTGRGLLLAKKYSPEMLMATGIIAIVGGTVMACKATLKAEDILEEAKDKFDMIEEAKETQPEGYQEADYKKDIAIVRTQTAIKFVKIYGPAATMTIAGIACMLGAHNIMKKRNVALMAAYKLVEQGFSDYRQRVVEKYGEKEDYNFKQGIREESITMEENGKKKKTIATVCDPNAKSVYARWYDETCTQWTKTPEYNLAYLKSQQNYWNDMLKSRGHVFLNEVYDALGMERCQAGAVVGWVLGEGDNYVDFGIFTDDSPAVRDFVNGRERSVLLDFNVDGIIYDLI